MICSWNRGSCGVRGSFGVRGSYWLEDLIELGDLTGERILLVRGSYAVREPLGGVLVGIGFCFDIICYI